MAYFGSEECLRTTKFYLYARVYAEMATI